TAMASALLRIPVRQNIAMTGEVTLRGRVLPIGGLKEKILAAHRAGVTVVLIPDENRKDLKDIPESVLAELVVHPVKHMDEVLRFALAHPQPDEFLREPSSVVDWRIVETMPPSDPRGAHSLPREPARRRGFAALATARRVLLPTACLKPSTRSSSRPWPAAGSISAACWAASWAA